jgi:hypothetical protein
MTDADEIASLREDVTHLKEAIAVLKEYVAVGIVEDMRRSHAELAQRFEEISQRWLADLRVQLDQMAVRLGMSAEPGSGGKIGRVN